MKIQKFIKKNTKQYIIKSDEELVLYDETILRFNLLSKKEIDDKLLQEIKEYDESIKIYYKLVRSLTSKRKTEYEIVNYLKSINVNEKSINEIINKLKNNNLINDETYINAFIHDGIYLKNKGPRKLEVELLNLGYNLSYIRDKINNIDNEIYISVINRLINKKIKANHRMSGKLLKIKIASYIVHQGFTKEMVMNEIEKYVFSDEDALKEEYNKLYRKLSKKYNDEILLNKIKYKLLEKGFTNDQIDIIIKGE